MGAALERATEDRWNPALAQVSTAPPGLGSIPLDSQGSAARLSPLRFTLIGIQSTLVRTEYLAAVVAFLSFLLLFSFFVDAVNSVENG